MLALPVLFQDSRSDPMRKILLMLLALAMPAAAYQVQPMIVEIESVGKKSMITYRLQNPGNLPLPVEIEVMRRTFDENQKEVLVPADKDFLVLPPQIEVAANGYQIFRAKYLGNPKLEQTGSYRIIFKQLPLSDEKQQSGVKMMFNFATLVFVTPKGVTPTEQNKLDCVTAEACSFTISNNGKRVLDLSHFDYHFNNGETVVNWNEMQKLTTGRFIMPGHQMVVELMPVMNGKTTENAQMVNLFEAEKEDD